MTALDGFLLFVGLLVLMGLGWAITFGVYESIRHHFNGPKHY